VGKLFREQPSIPFSCTKECAICEPNNHPAVDLVAHQVLTAYHVTRKRKAVQKPLDQRQGQRPEFDDDLSDI